MMIGEIRGKAEEGQAPGGMDGKKTSSKVEGNEVNNMKGREKTSQRGYNEGERNKSHRDKQKKIQ